eukprot:1292450-Rhodomonas_salina.2
MKGGSASERMGECCRRGTRPGKHGHQSRRIIDTNLCCSRRALRIRGEITRKRPHGPCDCGEHAAECF